jgi:predicted HTH transcriptional regulator
MNLMEQRGGGFARMRDTMLNHGLDALLYSHQDGYFVATIQGPNGNYERLKLSERAVGFITPAVEAQLNERQKTIMVQVQREGEHCGKNRIARLMRQHQFKARQKRRFVPRTTRSDHDLPIAPNLLA